VPVATVPGPDSGLGGRSAAAGAALVAEFPAFFTRHSGFAAPAALPSPAACAALLHTQHQLGLATGAVFAAPIPAEHEAAGAVIEAAIQQVRLRGCRGKGSMCSMIVFTPFLFFLLLLLQALAEASERKIAGRDVTPFILRRVNEITGGASLHANIELVRGFSLATKEKITLPHHSTIRHHYTPANQNLRVGPEQCGRGRRDCARVRAARRGAVRCREGGDKLRASSAVGAGSRAFAASLLTAVDALKLFGC
jgi:hypothetical protein